MKKMIFALILLLLAGPVMASTVAITVDPNQNGYATIKYNADANVRAFALDVNVSAGTITEVTDYKTNGECTTKGDKKGYGIYLDQVTGIDINDAGVVQGYGNPVADINSPGGAGSGIGHNKVVLGLGALYVENKQPARNGMLCKIRVSAACNVSVTAENTYRGGVVMEDGNAPTTLTLTGATNIPVGVDCLPTDNSGYVMWSSVGKPSCWCYPRNCRGDTDNTATGNTLTGYYYVGSSDMLLAAQNYKKLEPPKGSGITLAQQCANVARDLIGNTLTGYYYIGSTDMTTMVTYYKKLEPPKGSGIPVCANID